MAFSILFKPRSASLPSSSPAALAIRNNQPYLAFDDTTQETAYFEGYLPDTYGGNGLTVTLVWLSEDQTTGDCVWQAAIERHQDDTTDLDSDSFASDQSVTSTTASAAGEPQYATITFTDGTQMDSLAAGESFRLRIRRDPSNMADDLTNDAQLKIIAIKET